VVVALAIHLLTLDGLCIVVCGDGAQGSNAGGVLLWGLVAAARKVQAKDDTPDAGTTVSTLTGVTHQALADWPRWPAVQACLSTNPRL
jgi:hypothetical protein